MYADFIQRRFPENDKEGLYVRPKLPAVKLGKILMKERKVKQPGDVMAMHLDEGVFSSSYILFTDTGCFYDGQSFLWEDTRTAKADGKKILVTLNAQGAFNERTLKAKSEEAARMIATMIDNIAFYDPGKEIENIEQQYEGFESPEIDWLKLRDEVMRTIDMLAERFNDGKLSLLEYEEKKEELLKRL